MTLQQIEDFLDRYVSGNYSEAEHVQFLGWYQQAPEEDRQQVAEKYRLMAEEFPAMPTMKYNAVQRMESLLSEFEKSKRENQSIPAKIVAFNDTKKNWRKWVAAAAVVLLVSTAYMWFQQSKHTADKNQTAKSTNTVNNDVLPGGNKAILTLADGTTVDLDSAKNGLIGEQGKTSILKTADGRLAYNNEGHNAGQVFFNKVTTPNGGTYMLVLSDGTKAWLNAASSLQFPAQFTGKERRVAVSGEVYFDVAHNAEQPFVVQVDHIEVHDIGTEFNINAYFDEPSIQTTLIKGAASVTNNGQTILLEPGKMAVVKGKETKLADANLQQATAWKDGNFFFKSMDIESIMRQIGRWYDVGIKYESEKPMGTFSGIVSRSKKLSEVVRVLEQYDVRCTIEGHTLIVK